jgi:hypothetical protein
MTETTTKRNVLILIVIIILLVFVLVGYYFIMKSDDQMGIFEITIYDANNNPIEDAYVGLQNEAYEDINPSVYRTNDLGRIKTRTMAASNYTIFAAGYGYETRVISSIPLNESETKSMSIIIQLKDLPVIVRGNVSVSVDVGEIQLWVSNSTGTITVSMANDAGNFALGLENPGNYTISAMGKSTTSNGFTSLNAVVGDKTDLHR